MEYSSEVLKIVEGALKSDKLKVINYTKLLTEKMMANNEARLANSFLKLLSTNASALTQISANELMKVPVDKESRLSMADILYPAQASDVKIVLNKEAHMQIDKFLSYYANSNKLTNLGISVPSTMLLYGPPGCGKSKLAAYICAKVNLPLVTARLDGLISSYLGSTSKNIRAIFEYAQSTPCILFLDEFDAIAKVRDDNNELGELKRVVNSLLQNIDNLRNESIIIAATNHDHLLDPAIWRRFGFKIPIEKPEYQTRIDLIKLFLGNDTFALKELDQISLALSGISGADIEEISNKVIIDSVIQEKPITLELIFDNIFEFLKIGSALQNEHYTIKDTHRDRAKYLRDINEKVFSYAQIASILGVSKSYISDLLRTREEINNE